MALSMESLVGIRVLDLFREYLKVPGALDERDTDGFFEWLRVNYPDDVETVILRLKTAL